MGLDSVELVMDWEEEFGVDIPDEVAATLTTPRLATDYIFSQVERERAGECIRQQTFFRLRRGFRRVCSVRRGRFQLSTPLSDLVARRDWPLAWSQVRLEDPKGGWPAKPPLVSAAGYEGSTVEGLVQELSSVDPRASRSAGRGWTREQVSLRLRRMVKVYVAGDAFNEDDHFVRDMGLQ